MTELDYILEASKRFYKEAGFEYPTNAREYYQSLLDNDFIFAKVIIGKGFIVGCVTPYFLTPHLRVCSELAWYVEPEFRGSKVAIKLIREYEKEALSRGCDKINLVALESLTPDKVGNIYKKLGYNKLENHYIKGTK